MSDEALQDKIVNYLSGADASRSRLHITNLHSTSGCKHRIYSVELEYTKSERIHHEELILRLFEGGNAREEANREYNLLTRLKDTDIPVPKAHFLEERADTLGCPFIVMDRVKGHPLTLQGLPPGEQEHLADRFAAYLAKLHALDYTGLGLDFLSVPMPPHGFVDSKLAGFRFETEHIVENSKEDIDLEWIYRRRDIRTVLNWLHAHRDSMTCPAYALLHGDYHRLNVMCADGRITGIIDWELARIGDPMADLGYSLALGVEDLIDRYRNYAEVYLDRVYYYQVYTVLLGLFLVLALKEYGSEKLGWKVPNAPEEYDKMLQQLYCVVRERTGLDIAHV